MAAPRSISAARAAGTTVNAAAARVSEARSARCMSFSLSDLAVDDGEVCILFRDGEDGADRSALAFCSDEQRARRGNADGDLDAWLAQELPQASVVAGIEVRFERRVRQEAETGERLAAEDAADDTAGGLRRRGDRDDHAAGAHLLGERLGGRRLRERFEQVVSHSPAEVHRRHRRDALAVLAAARVARAVDRNDLDLALEGVFHVGREVLAVVGGVARRGDEADRAGRRELDPGAVGGEGLAEAELAAAQQGEPAGAGDAFDFHWASQQVHAVRSIFIERSSRSRPLTPGPSRPDTTGPTATGEGRKTGGSLPTQRPRAFFTVNPSSAGDSHT